MVRRYLKQAYGKKRYKKKKQQSKGSWLTTVKDVASVASSALTIAKGVAAIVNAEHKYIETELPYFNVDNTNWIAGSFNLCAEGDDYNMRNGRSIKAKNLRVRFSVIGQSSFNAGIGRLVIVRDIGAQGSIVAGSQIFSNTSNADNRVFAMRNVQDASFKRYQILKDMTFQLDTTNKRISTVEFTIPVNKHCYYIGTSALATDLGSGALSYYFTSQGSTGSNTGMKIQLLARLYYVDN